MLYPFENVCLCLPWQIVRMLKCCTPLAIGLHLSVVNWFGKKDYSEKNWVVLPCSKFVFDFYLIIEKDKVQEQVTLG